MVDLYFRPEEVGDYPQESVEGKYLILNPEILSRQYRSKPNMVWKALGGFGCVPYTRGTAIMAQCVSDGEKSRWERGDFIHEYVGDIEKLKQEFAELEVGEYI